MGKVSRRLTWAVVALVCGGRAVAAQEIEPLGQPAERAAQGFTSVFDVAELADGRLLVTDNREPSLALVDLRHGTVERIGREGQGPREFRGVFSIVRRPDGLHVYDASNARFLIVSPDGVVIDSRRFTPPPFSGLAPPRGPDPEGGVYFDLRTVGPRGLDRPAVLYRWDTETGAADSVATVMQYGPGQGGRGPKPMPQADAWSVLPDGSVLRLVAEDYHAEWSGGRLGTATGSPIPFPQREVDAGLRDEWIAQMLASSGGRSRISGSASGASESQMRRYRSQLDAARFPDIQPPFTGGYKPAAPWGEVWVRLDPASDDERTVFDVIGRQGELVRRVSVDGVARVVGFGPESVYLVRIDEFDLQWLERYDRPD